MAQPTLGMIGGVGKHSQINYEAGKRHPDAKYLCEIASVGADVLYILTGQRNEPVEPLVAPLDEPRLIHAIEIVERGLHEAGRVAAPSVKAGMISAAYEMLEMPEEATVGRILRLVKG